MDPRKFESTEFGEVYRDPATGWDHVAFKPAPLPRSVALDPETILALSEADAALGQLAGAGRQLHDPSLLVQPYITREALASSRIEGTQASLSDVFQAEAEKAEDGALSGDVFEVGNYIAAMAVGLESDMPFVGRVVRQIHERLLTGVRGENRRLGEFRKRPVWIGSPTDHPETAVFVPPLPKEMKEAWRDWEDFANTTVRMPKLIQCALLHYQFETIHPFFDGNGRLGRLLIVFYLVKSQKLSRPLLYISSYLEEHRREYYERLQAVRERGELQEWLQFFLTAVAVQAEDGIQRAERLYDLRELYRAELVGSRTRAVAVVDLLFANPVVTARRVASELGVSHQGALNLIRLLERKGWLTFLGTLGRGGRTYWMAPEIYEALAEPTRTSDQASPDLTRS